MPSSPPKINVVTAAKLQKKELDPLRFVIPGILPEGLSQLAGRPKSGKSWLALHMAVAKSSGGVALGKIQVPAGDVLYLALEDGERRLQRRLQKMGGDYPARLHLGHQWPRGKEAVTALEQWFEEHPGTDLVVIDTWPTVKDAVRGNASVYESDYEAMAPFQKLATAKHAAILMVLHTRKARFGVEGDPLDEVQSSTGLTAAADAVLVLRRQRHSQEASLFVTGRDLVEGDTERQLLFDEEYCLWQLTQHDPEKLLPPDRRKVRGFIREAGKPLGIQEITTLLGKGYDATNKLLGRLIKDGLLVKAGYGQYALPDESASNSSNSSELANWPPGPTLQLVKPPEE
jgi:hypothetical protein